MIGIQILAILFIVWMTYFSYLHYRRREFSLYEFIFWQILWLGLLIIVLSPKSVSFLLRTFNINRTFDLVVVAGIVVLFGISFRNYVLLKRTERKVEELTRRLAMK